MNEESDKQILQNNDIDFNETPLIKSKSFANNSNGVFEELLKQSQLDNVKY